MEDAKVRKALGAASFLQETFKELSAESDGKYDHAAGLVGELKEIVEEYVKDKLFDQWVSE